MVMNEYISNLLTWKAFECDSSCVARNCFLNCVAAIAQIQYNVPKPPPEKMDETDYVDLLLEYKQIQDQLKNIAQAEQRASQSLSTEEGNWSLKISFHISVISISIQLTAQTC